MYTYIEIGASESRSGIEQASKQRELLLRHPAFTF